MTRSIDYVCAERYLRFPEAHIGLAAGNGSITVSSDAFARCVELTGDADGDEFGWLFSDNYFDLMPWESKKIEILGDHKKGTVRAGAFNAPHLSEVQYGG
jgi:hypothetical protein